MSGIVSFPDVSHLSPILWYHVRNKGMGKVLLNCVFYIITLSLYIGYTLILFLYRRLYTILIYSNHIEEKKREKAEDQVRDIEGRRPKCKPHSGKAKGKGFTALLVGLVNWVSYVGQWKYTCDCFHYSVAELWGFKRFEADNMDWEYFRFLANNWEEIFPKIILSLLILRTTLNSTTYAAMHNRNDKLIFFLYPFFPISLTTPTKFIKTIAP